MSAKIILTQADFSQNNIGRYIGFDPLTEKVLAKQTLYSIDGSEANILDDYIVGLKEKRFIGGDSPLLSVLMLPCLAKDHSELFFNLAQLDENGNPTDWMPAAEASAAESDRVYICEKRDTKTLGVYSKAIAGSIIQGGTLGFKIPGDPFVASSQIPSISFFTYLYSAMTASSLETRPLVGSSVAWRSEIMMTCNFGIVRDLSSNQAKITTANTTCPAGFYGMSFNKDNLSVLVNLNGTTTGTDDNVGTSIKCASIATEFNNSFELISSNANSIASAHTSIVGFGSTALSATQLAELKTLSDTFINALNII